MQISVLKKLMQLISPSDSLEEKSLSEEILESSPEESEEEEFEIQNSEFEIEGDEEEFEIDEHTNEMPLSTVSTKNTKAHLTSSVPRAAKAPSGILTKGELKEIRALFNNMDDNEIHRLYKKVTK